MQRILPAGIVLAVFLLATGAKSADASALVFAQAFARCVGTDIQSDPAPVFATAKASISGTPSDPDTCPESDPAFNEILFGDAMGTASLASGHLQGSAVAGFTFIDPTLGGLTLASGDVISQIFDTVTIHGPGGSFSTTAGLRLHVEGDTFGWGYVLGSFIASRSGSFFFSSLCAGGLTTVCYDGIRVSDAGPFAFDVVLPIRVTSSSPSFNMTASLSTGAMNDGLADALGSGQLFIDLRPGFSFTSESGLLLTEPATVPEPGTLVLIGVGLSILGARRRRGRSQG